MSSNRSKPPQGSGHSGTHMASGASSIRSGLSARSSASGRGSADLQSPIRLSLSSTQLQFRPRRRTTSITITQPERRTRTPGQWEPMQPGRSQWETQTGVERQLPNETVIWDIYNEKVEVADRDLTTDFNSSMDVLLIFAGLFSAVLAAFIMETYKLLLPDQTDLTNQLVHANLQNQTASLVVPSANFSPPPYAVRVNAMFFASLMVSLLTALIAMLVKQWVGYYERGIRNINGKQIKARTRQFRYNGMVRWHLADIVALVPMFLHLSLFLFFIGVVDFLFVVARPIAIASVAVISPGIFLYIAAHILPMASSGAPFRSPFTHFLDELVLKVRRNRTLKQAQNIATEEEGYVAMEDPSSLWFGEDGLEARTVQLTRALDIEVVTWLMRHLDKKTERDRLDMCFEKLMAFRDISSSSFYRREIPLTYQQLARTCLIDFIGPIATISAGRIERAGLLCRFLLWYLSLPRDDNEQQWLKEHLPLSETTAFLQAVYRFSRVGLGEITETGLIARWAYRLLSHLHLPNNASCDVCLGETEIMKPLVYIPPNDMIQELRSITECVLSRSAATAERIDQALDIAVNFIRNNPIVIGRGYQPFLQQLRRDRPSHPPGSRWCDTLIDAIVGAEEVVADEPGSGTPSERRGSDIAIPGMIDIAIPEATDDEGTPSVASDPDNSLPDKWLDGPYGPVLDATTARILGVKLQINPILGRRRSEPGDHRMIWNVLDAVHKAYLVSISGLPGVKWYESSATLPRINNLVLHSNHLPGAIEVVGTSNSGAITCGDVVIAIHEFCKKKISRHVYNSVGRSKRAKVDAMYLYNRSGKMGAPDPDHPDLGGGIRNGDFLEEYTSFAGLDDDEESVRLLLGLGGKQNESTNERAKEEITTTELKERHWVGHLVLNLEYRSGENVSVSEETDANEFSLTTMKDLENGEDEDRRGGYLEAKKGGYDTNPAKRRGKDNILYHQQQPLQHPSAFSTSQQWPPSQMHANILGYPNFGTPLQDGGFATPGPYATSTSFQPRSIFSAD